MTSIRALPSITYVIPSNIEKVHNRPQEPDSSSFQNLLKAQSEPSQITKKTVINTQLEQARNISPYRPDSDWMLAQLLASRKMLLHPMNKVCQSTTTRKGFTDCEYFSEDIEMYHSEHVNEHGSSLCNKRINDHVAPETDYECQALAFNNQLICQQQFPAVTTSSFATVFIWVAPEIIRFPAKLISGKPLRIRRIRLLSSLYYGKTERI